jgi:hypothetical protein
MVEALPHAQKDENKTRASMLYQSLADALFHDIPAFQLQTLTDIAVLPDYEDGHYYGYVGSSGAPVDAEGNPVYYYVPESWEASKNDGERWRWALDQAAKSNPNYQKDAWRKQADFYRSQFGEQTLQGFNFYRSTEQDPEKTASILTLETLSDDETIAKLATGIKRFKLPDEFNYIRLYQEINDIDSLQKLAEIAKNRRQYPKAAKYYEDLIERTNIEEQKANWRRQRDQITGNWGRF